MKITLTNKPFILLTTLLILGGLIYGGYTYYQSRQIKPSSTPTQETKPYEITTNSDGSQTFICYKFGFKITYPSTWEFLKEHSSISPKYDSGWVQLLLSSDKSAERLLNGILISAGSPRDKSLDPTLRDRIQATTGKASIPAEPNTIISGSPAFEYDYISSGTYQDVVETVFETQKNVFTITIPYEAKGNEEYRSIINSFEFL